MDSYPDPGGPKTCGSGSGFGSGSATLGIIMLIFFYSEAARLGAEEGETAGAAAGGAGAGPAAGGRGPGGGGAGQWPPGAAGQARGRECPPQVRENAYPIKAYSAMLVLSPMDPDLSPDPAIRQQKTVISLSFSAYYFMKVHLDRRNQGFSYYFCLMIEGSGSRFRKPKNM